MEEKDDLLELTRRVESADMSDLPVAGVLGLKGLVYPTMVQQFFPPSLHATGANSIAPLPMGNDPGAPPRLRPRSSWSYPGVDHDDAIFLGIARDFRLEPEITKAFCGVAGQAVPENVEALEAIEGWRGVDNRKANGISARGDNGALLGRLMEKRKRRVPVLAQAGR